MIEPQRKDLTVRETSLNRSRLAKLAVSQHSQGVQSAIPAPSANWIRLTVNRPHIASRFMLEDVDKTVEEWGVFPSVRSIGFHRDD